MGTAVLLPHDCLPASKGRHKSNFSDVLYGSNGIPTRSRDGTFQVVDSYSFYPDQSRQKFNSYKRFGWNATPGSLLLPEQGRTVASTNSLHKEVDGKKARVRRPVDPRDSKFVSKPVRVVPVITILQRPKDKEVTNEPIAKCLVKVDETKPTLRLPESKADQCNKLLCGTQSSFLDTKNGGSIIKKKVPDQTGEGPKFPDSKSDVPKLQGSALSFKESKVGKGKYNGTILASSKPASMPKKSGSSRFDDLLSAKGLNQMLSPKVTGDHKSLRTAGAAENFSCKFAYENQPGRVDNVVEGGLARLRRASTDPQIVNHLVGQYTSEVMPIPHSDARSFLGITRSSSMSCPERWAGPAYCSSPAPSSLPLPKFSLLNQKISSPNFSPLSAEGCNMKVIQPPEMGSVRALPGVPQRGELDVASATRSLRRILKLEPL